MPKKRILQFAALLPCVLIANLTACNPPRPFTTPTSTATTTDTPTATFTPSATPSPTITATPTIGPEEMAQEADLNGVNFAWGGEHNDIPMFRQDENGNWVEVEKVVLSSEFPKTQSDIDALPPVRIDDTTNGSMARSTLESLTDEEIADLVPATWSRASYPAIGAESISPDLASLPQDLDLDLVQYSKAVRYGRSNSKSEKRVTRSGKGVKTGINRFDIGETHGSNPDPERHHCRFSATLGVSARRTQTQQ